MGTICIIINVIILIVFFAKIVKLTNENIKLKSILMDINNSLKPIINELERKEK